MRNFKKTAIAMGVAQIAFMYGGASHAQEAAPAPAEGNVVVVTGQRAALQSAQKIKQNSDEIVDSIVADDIGKLPDRSVTEVLQRVVGVTMERTVTNDPQHFAVEGSGISIRGLNYVRSELNGRDSFSANGGRSLNFEDVPPELMAGVDVYKNPSAEQIEGAISGLVNLRTAMPFDHKGFRGAISATGSYSKLRGGKVTPSYSALLSNRWKTDSLGEFGILFDIAHSESNTRTDAYQLDPLYPRENTVEPGKTVWVPKGALWRTTNYDREREGKYVAAQWRPFRELTMGLTYFRSDYTMPWSEQALLMQHSTPYSVQVKNGVYDANGAFVSGELSDPSNGGLAIGPARRVADRDSSTTDIAFNADWRVTPNFRLRTDVQRIKAKSNGFDSEVATGYLFPRMALDVSGKLPVLEFTEQEKAAMADPKNYWWGSTMEHLDRSKAGSKALKIDGQYDFDNPVLRDVRFGVRFTDRDSHVQNTNPSYNWQGVSQKWMAGPEDWRLINTLPYLSDPRFANATSVYNFQDFMSGKSSIPGVVFPADEIALGYPDSYNTLHGYRKILCQEKGRTDCDTLFRLASWNQSPAEHSVINEKTKALYTQIRFGFDDLKFPIDGNFGVRYVKTDTVASGYANYRQGTFSIPEGATVTGVPLISIPDFAKSQDFVNSFHNWLPTLNLRLKASDTLQFRFAVGSAISRPSFNQMQANTNLSRRVTARDTLPEERLVDITGVTLTGDALGNPMLKPVKANQVDLTAEWYPAPGKSVTFALFNKELKDIVIDRIANYNVIDSAGQPRAFEVTGPVNGAKGYARGFELAGQTYFDNLPSWAQGLGAQASFTFVDSERKLYNPVFQPYCSDASEAATNFNLFVNGCDTDGRSFTDLPLAGLSRRTINFTLMYDRGPVSARLAYNWRSRQMQQVAAWGVRANDGVNMNPSTWVPGSNPDDAKIYYGLPLWASSYGQLDGGFEYKVSDNLQISVDAQNLNNAIFKQEMQQHVGMIGHAWFASGPRYSASIRYKF